MNKTTLNEINNQCASVQACIAQNYDTPDNEELSGELLALLELLVKLFEAKT